MDISDYYIYGIVLGVIILLITLYKLGVFKSKKKKPSEQGEDLVENSVSDAKSYEKYRLKEDEYWAIVKDQNGDSSIERRFIRCKRFQYEDGVVTLKPVNKKENFEEIFPQLEPDFQSFNMNEIKNKLQALQNKLKLIEKGQIKNVNMWNVKWEIFQLKAAERKLKFGKCNFMTFNIHREPCFTFIRKGSTLHPLAEDLDTNSIYVPSDYKKKKSAMSVRNKENKYSKYASALVSVGAAILLIVNVVMFVGNAWWSYSIMKYSDSESSMAHVDQRFEQTIGICTDALAVNSRSIANSANQIEGITGDLKDHLEPTTMISGEEPLDFTR